MVRLVSTEKMDILKSITSSDTQFYMFSHGYDFKHTSTSPHCPQANGEAESGVSIAKKILKMLKILLMMGREIRTLLPTLEFY